MISNDDSPPSVPPKDAKHRYTINTPIATILMHREVDFHASPRMPSTAEVFLSQKIDSAARLADYDMKEDEFWLEFIQKFDDTYIKGQSAQKIEHKMLSGVPAQLRCLIYFSILNLSNTVDIHTYESLVKKAKLAKFEGGVASSPVLEDSDELLLVYYYCLEGSSYVSSQASGLIRPEIIENLARILQLAEGVTRLEALTVLLRITERLSSITQNAFCYKGSRCLEDFASEQFLHFTKQGISIARFFETVFERLTDDSMEKDVLISIFELVLLEGPEFCFRLLCSLFEEQKDKILSLDREELQSHLFSKGFVSTINLRILQRSLEIDFPIVKYENEYSLMNANSISGNDNEITNLQEANIALKLKLKSLRERYTQLQVTHEEIFEQNSEYAEKLAQAQEKKVVLLKRKETLQQKYNQLTMQENLSNTIKANMDISTENQSLEQQIQIMTRKVEAKSKLIK